MFGSLNINIIVMR